LLVLAGWGLSQAAKPEKTYAIQVHYQKVCSLGKEILLEQDMVRSIGQSVVDRVHKDKTYRVKNMLLELDDQDRVVGRLTEYTLCERDLYKAAVFADGHGKTRFHADAAWLKSKGVEGLTSDVLSRRLLGTLMEKYPGSQAYELVVAGTLYDYQRSGEFNQKYEKYEVIDQRPVEITDVSEQVALPTLTFTPTPLPEKKGKKKKA